VSWLIIPFSENIVENKQVLVLKSYLQIYNLSFGEKSKILFDKIKRQLYKNSYSTQQRNQYHLEDQIQRLQNQVNSLHDLETKLMFEENSKYALSRTRMDDKIPFTSQQADYTLKPLFARK
jgi:hypothetical protein